MKRTRALGQRLLTPGNTLSQRVIHAGFWAFALRIVDRLFGLARTVILARLLAPEDFGLFGIALLALSMLETFSETGFNAAIIQKKGDVKPYLDTAWTVQVIRGFLLAILLLVIAPYVAMFFGEPGAASLVRALALVTVLRGLVNSGVLYFRKELEFHKEFIYMFSGTLTDLGVAILAALILRNAWALIWGLLAGQFVRIVVSYLVHPYRPRPQLRRDKARELYTFGRWIFASSILVFLLNHGDDIFLGKLLGATALGLYQMAYRLSNLPATEITHVISQVTFPAYSKLQDRLPQLRQAYLQTLQVTAFLSFPITGAIIFFAPDFTRIFLGDQWMPMVPAMQILAVWGLSRSIAATTGPLFSGMGVPRISTWLQLIKLILMGVFIYPFTVLWGISGTAIAVAISALIVDPICIYVATKILRSRVLCTMRVFLTPVAGSMTMLLSMTLLSHLSTKVLTLGDFLGHVVLGGVVYIVTIIMLDRKSIQRLWRLVFE